jgi:hypothetical protein
MFGKLRFTHDLCPNNTTVYRGLYTQSHALASGGEVHAWDIGGGILLAFAFACGACARADKMLAGLLCSAQRVINPL